MTIKDLKERFPKAMEKLVAFNKNALKALQLKMAANAGVEVEFPDITNEQAEMSIEGLLIFNTRALFDFFDAEGVEIEIYKGWKYDVDGESEDEFNSRVECENAAFLEAFKFLEGK